MQFHLRKRYKHFARYREITNILVRHGFGYLAHQLGLTEFLSFGRRYKLARRFPDEGPLKIVERPSPPERLRRVLEELGPTFIKLGQVLSTRSDLLSPEYIAELEKLQDQVPPFPFAQVRERIQMELGVPLEEIFIHFDATPLAAASIGQVHRANLRDGRPVVVKVQRPGTEKTLLTDVEILYDVARLVDRHGPWREFYRFEEMVEEFEKILREEMDFTVEGRHANTFRQHFAGDNTVYFPIVYWDYTTSKVLTMEYIEGVKMTHPEELTRRGIDRRVVARHLADALLRQILLHGFFHGDPHPGNLAALPDGRIAFMDFGIVGRLTEEMREKIGALVLGLVRRSTAQVVQAVEALGVVPPHVDRAALHRDIDALREKYYEIPLSRISLAESLGDVMAVAFKHRIRVPTQFTLLVKSLVTAEGVVAQLDPDLSIVEIARPMGKRLLARRFSLPGIKRLLLEHLEDYHQLLTRLPHRLDRVLDLAAGGELKIKAVNPDLDRMFGQLNAMVNRLVLGILLGSLIVGSSLLLGRGYTILWGLPVAEAAFVVGGVLGVALIFSILRSRRF
ncbi:ABC1 kinase family protein [Desulfofundulus thermosubterraneus]|uniref:Ubiquinone biosynthesis protein n=1 Tax=Desulfofundulus thermosubterraneus DSM 16057 TaxID=1121432 RepID=A0A1M6MC63_9FIRM|nr:AarF/ABC1/UbiB kinase family protein [Desulfofundulus thermosubterraneus]SHJ81061.1 ubiquinone biosynthesis protein [Desulfofundulus thermosubterraneus DSM 16057]